MITVSKLLQTCLATDSNKKIVAVDTHNYSDVKIIAEVYDTDYINILQSAVLMYQMVHHHRIALEKMLELSTKRGDMILEGTLLNLIDNIDIVQLAALNGPIAVVNTMFSPKDKISPDNKNTH